jgi:hypothetical protein
MDKFLIRKPATTADTKSTKQSEPHLSAASTNAIISEQNKNIDSNILCKDLSDISANGKKLLQHKLSAYPKNKVSKQSGSKDSNGWSIQKMRMRLFVTLVDNFVP